MVNDRMLEFSLDSARSQWGSERKTTTLSLPEQIAEQVGKSIIEGEYEPGARIQEQELAEQFEVSRGPVREALRILEQHGLVQITARKGAQITNLTAEEVRQIFDVRVNLVGLAAWEATRHQDPDFLSQIKKRSEFLMQLAKTSDNVDEYVSSSYQTNVLIMMASRNKFLKSIILSLALQTMRYTRLGLSSKARRIQSAGNYQSLSKAMIKNDPTLAKEIAERLVSESREMAVSLLEQQSDEPV